jgi:hypothetical protein
MALDHLAAIGAEAASGVKSFLDVHLQENSILTRTGILDYCLITLTSH